MDQILRGFGGREKKAPERNCDHPLAQHNMESTLKNKNKHIDSTVCIKYLTVNNGMKYLFAYFANKPLYMHFEMVM